MHSRTNPYVHISTKNVLKSIKGFLYCHIVLMFYISSQYMKPIKQFLVNVIINGLIFYVVVNHIPELWLVIQSEYKDTIVIFGILWLIFRFFNAVLKRILNILTLPVKYLTLGISSLIINILMLYVFEQVINYLDVGITIQLGTIVQVCVLSLVLTITYFAIKKLI